MTAAPAPALFPKEMSQRPSPYLFLLIAGSIAALSAAGARAGESPGRGAFDTREAFDAMVDRLSPGHLQADNETGGLAWGNSYLMEAYVAMYGATGDTAYLDRLVTTADAALSKRDSETGARDYQGLSHPGWTAGAHYSIGEIVLNTAEGHPALYLSTSFYGYNNLTEIAVTAGRGGAFDLRITNERYGVDESFRELEMDPESPRFAPAVIGESKLAEPFHPARLKVRHLTGGGSKRKLPLAPVRAQMEPQRYLWPVHQGMITYPMVAFARLVQEEPELAKEDRYREKAREFVGATVEIMEVLEADWRENEQGEGWYSVARGAPVWLDGLDEPHNHFLAVGRAMVELAAVTRDPRWNDRAEKMARTFRNDLSLQENGSYVWPYWWSKGYAYNGWGPGQDVSDNTPALPPVQVAEDYSHGSIDVHFAWLCHRNGIVFEKQDMERIAATFTGNLLAETEAGRPTLHERVDGTGRLSHHDQRGPNWVLFAEHEPKIFEVFRGLWEDERWTPRLVQMLASANLNLMAAKLPPSGEPR